MQQPWAWALVHGNADVLNLNQPIPDKYFQGRLCAARCYMNTRPNVMDMRTYVAGALCSYCGGSGVEPLRVFIHAGTKPAPIETILGIRDQLGLSPFRAMMFHSRKESVRAGIGFGALVATATIHPGHQSQTKQCKGKQWVEKMDGGYWRDAKCSQWAHGQPKKWHYPVTDVTPIDPVPCRGRTGLWTPNKDALNQKRNQQ